MRLGFHYHVPAVKDEHGRICTPGYQGLFLDSLAAGCERLVCFLHEPLPGERLRMDYQIRGVNVDLVSLGPRESVPRRVLHARRTVGSLRDHLADLDVLLLRGPSPLLPAMAAGAGNL